MKRLCYACNQFCICFDYPGSGTAAAVLDGWNRGCGEKFMYMCENRMASDA